LLYPDISISLSITPRLQYNTVQFDHVLASIVHTCPDLDPFTPAKHNGLQSSKQAFTPI
jgi:hypothetical protein